MWLYCPALSLIGLSLVPIGAKTADPPVLSLPDGGSVSAVAFSAKQDRVAVLGDSGDNHVVFLYEFPTLKPRGKIKLEAGFSSMAFSPCGDYLAMNGHADEPGHVRLWDLRKSPPKLSKILAPARDMDRELRARRLWPEMGFVTHVSFSADGEWALALDQATTLHAWRWKKQWRAEVLLALELQPGLKGLRPTEHSSRVVKDNILLTSKVDQQELLTFQDKGVRVLKVLAGVTYNVAPPFLTPDLKTAVSWSRAEREARVHDISGDRAVLTDTIRDFRDHPKWDKGLQVLHVAATPDRSVVMVSYTERLAYVAFFPRTPQRRKEFGLDRTQTQLVLRIVGEDDASQSSPALTFSPDGRWFIFTGGNCLDTRFWPVDRLGEVLQTARPIFKQ